MGFRFFASSFAYECWDANSLKVVNGLTGPESSTINVTLCRKFHSMEGEWQGGGPRPCGVKIKRRLRG
jgi:hypothetical protein